MSSTTPTVPVTTPDIAPESSSDTSRHGRRLSGLGRLARSTTAAVLITAAAALATAGTAQADTDSPATPVVTPAVAPAAYTTAVYYWGAIAYSPSTGAAGYTWDYPSSRSAARAAVTKCGVADCQSVVEVANGCASIAQADNYALGWAYGASRAASDATARRYANGPHPRVFGWVCTTGHQ